MLGWWLYCLWCCCSLRHSKPRQNTQSVERHHFFMKTLECITFLECWFNQGWSTFIKRTEKREMRGMMNFFTIFYEYTKSKNTHCPIPTLKNKNPNKKNILIQYVSTLELNELKSWDESFSTELYTPVLIRDLSLCWPLTVQVTQYWTP